MIIFNSDLDNTLIYSYKHDIGSEKTCVEVYQSRDISFMTMHSSQLLKKIAGMVTFVPTTTRSVEQYNRINLGLGTPEYALVCNGGILLVNGVSDINWYRDSLKQIADCVSDIDQSIHILEQDDNRCFEIRHIEQLFVFTKSNNPQQTVERLKSALNTEKVDVFENGTKVYVVPKPLNKGAAVKRLKERLSADIIISAGDSEFDITMLKVSDIAIAPECLDSKLMDWQGKHIVEGTCVFSDEMLKKVKHIIVSEISHCQ